MIVLWKLQLKYYYHSLSNNRSFWVNSKEAKRMNWKVERTMFTQRYKILLFTICLTDCEYTISEHHKQEAISLFIIIIFICLHEYLPLARSPISISSKHVTMAHLSPRVTMADTCTDWMATISFHYVYIVTWIELSSTTALSFRGQQGSTMSTNLHGLFSAIQWLCIPRRCVCAYLFISALNWFRPRIVDE